MYNWQKNNFKDSQSSKKRQRPKVEKIEKVHRDYSTIFPEFIEIFSDNK